MNYEKIEELLILHEGKKKFVYRCPAGKLTVGVGRNLEDKGLSEDEIEYLLQNDIKECISDLTKIFDNFFKLDDVRQAVLIDMRFNLGPTRFRSFKRMIKAVKEQDFQRAAEEMKDSKWFKQVKQRGQRLYEMMKTGKWWE
ncbi:glycoside hydrolase family protein [Desulfothermus naphthae]